MGSTTVFSTTRDNIKIETTEGTYYIIKEAKSYADAKSAAESDGGILASFETAAEYTALYTAVAAEYASDSSWGANTEGPGGGMYLRIGGTDGDTISRYDSSDADWNWKWVSDNSEIAKNRTEWGEGTVGTEPDNYFDGNNGSDLGGQDSLAIGLTGWGGSSLNKYGDAGEWNDVRDDRELYYLVETSESSSSETSTSSTTDDSTDSSSVTYYNTSTHETKTLAEMLAAGWMELSEESYGDTYQYPAIYSAGVISDENGPIRQALDMSDGDKVGDWIVISSDSGEDDMSENTEMVGSTNNDFIADSQGFSSTAASAPVVITSYEVGKKSSLANIKDYDGNLHGGDISEDASSAYEYHGMLDVNGDGTYEAIFTNNVSKRWVTAEVHSTYGAIDFDRNGADGGTRVVGIYEDPLIVEGSNNGGFLSDGVTPAPANFGVSDQERYVEVNGDTIDRLALNSQVRFQNDLEIDNLIAKTAGDYDSDGINEVYWKTNDGTAYLRALMHDDGNIRYANYQSEDQMNEYLTAQGHDSVIGEII